MDIEVNISEITTKLPTYLEVLLQDKISITLVYQQKNEVKGKYFYKSEKIEKCNDTSISELELTGTPLETDLGSNGDSIYEDDDVPIIPPSWTSEELKYYPISLAIARSYINEKLSTLKTILNKPIFCLCDANDPQSTIALGIAMDENYLTRIMVYILPCYSEDHKITTIDYMKEEHFANVGKNIKDVKTYYSIKEYYYLWGYDLKNCKSFDTTVHNGSIAVEIDLDMHKSTRNSKMILQVVLGHANSSLLSFWEDLSLIQSYINLLVNSKQLSERSVISKDCLSCDEISSLISDFLNSSLHWVKKTGNEQFDLKNLRQENILEKLWHTLKYCRDLSDLRDSLQVFFEKLAEIQTNIRISKDDMSKLGQIVNRIMEGTVIISPLTFVQCLELLVDLGLEKLKNDYVVLFNHFSTSAKEKIMEKWSYFCIDNTDLSVNNAFARKSRISITAKFSVNDISNCRIKLSYLLNLHKANELLFLYKENVKSYEKTFDQFWEAVCDHFIANDHSVGAFCDVNKEKLCEFTLTNQLDKTEIKGLSPVYWLVTMKTSTKLSEVTTVFHFSEFPIFPPSLFDNYEVSFENSQLKSLHVTKLVKYKGIC